MLAFRRPCADHRAELYAYIDRRERSAGTAAALGHLDRCRACEQELSEVALAVHALARLRHDLDAVEPSQDAWVRLRERIARGPEPWRFRASLAGLATSTLLVAVMVLPVALGRPVPGVDVAAPAGGEAASQAIDVPPPTSAAELRLEAAYLASIRTGTLPPTPREETGDGGGSRGIVFALYPQEMTDVRKEVPARPSHGRSPQPI